jgi:hypothetical protein
MERILMAFFTMLGLAFATLLGLTLAEHPLFPFRMDEVGWTSAWLLTTVGDYYTVAACLCGVIISTDGTQLGVAWSLAVCLLGSPFACAWIVWRLRSHGNLALVGVDDDFLYSAHR